MFAPLPIALAASAMLPQDPAPYGFSGHEIYKLAAGCSELRAGDLNGDGLGDLVVSNPRRSRIELLLRLPRDAEDFADRSEREQSNQVEYNGRFAIRHHPVEREVQQLAVGDWDGDDFDDVAWVAAGGELHVLFGDATGEIPRTNKRRVEALRAGCSRLETVDLDGDGRAELVAAGKRALIALSLGDAAAAVRELDVAESDLDGLAHGDLDGDGHADLIYLFHDVGFPVRYRPGRPPEDGANGLTGSGFGPRVDCELPAFRDAKVADLDGDGQVEVLAVFRDSGRVSVLDFAGASDDPAAEPRRILERCALRPTEKGDGRRTFEVGDLNGDGTHEIIAAEPDVSEVLVLAAQGGQLVSRSFPNLVEVAQPRLGDVDGDGVRELITMSASERMVGVARPTPDGELPFPTTLPVEGTPHALDVGDLDGDGADEIVVLSSTGSGRARAFQVEVRHGLPGGPRHEVRVQPLESLKKPPSALTLADLDQDGERDLMLFFTERDMPALVFRSGVSFEVDARGSEAPGLGVLAGARPTNVSFGDLDGDGELELLAASKNFARALRFERDSEGRATPVVIAQFNGPAPDSSISACLLVELDGAPPAELVLHDERERELLVLDRSTQTPSVRERIEAGRLELELLRAADVDGDRRADLVLLGQDQVAVSFAAGRSPALRPRSSYDPEIEKTYLDTLAAGDLNGDGQLDLLAIEGFEHHMVILSEPAGGEGQLARRLEFRVFEKRPLEEGRSREPRELLCTDLNGDGATDVAALVHDKLIVYLQD